MRKESSEQATTVGNVGSGQLSERAETEFIQCFTSPSTT